MKNNSEKNYKCGKQTIKKCASLTKKNCEEGGKFDKKFDACRKSHLTIRHLNKK